ncbi:MAG: glycoside hydrolase family 30 beta sandwich domain-containing protein [Luteolibacter sp.]
MKHFSSTVLPRARRITVRGGPFKNIVTFRNTDGDKVIQIVNKADQRVSSTLDLGVSSMRLDISPKSMNTLLIR